MSSQLFKRVLRSAKQFIGSRTEQMIGQAVLPCIENMEQRRLYTAVANTDTLTVGPGYSVLNVLANDTSDVGPVSVQSATTPAHGSVYNNGTSIFYTANYGYHGADTFNYTITDGSTTSTATVNLTIAGAGLDYDPAHIGTGDRTALIVYGTPGNDSIQFFDANNTITVTMNGVTLPGSYTSGTISHFVVYGDAGNDTIFSLTSTVPCLFYGQAGDDYMASAGGNDILVGGDGNDSLLAGGGRDFVFGGIGKDTLNGGLGDDILTGESTAYDAASVANIQSLYSMMAEWASGSTFATRSAHIRGTTGGLNAGVYLNSTKITKDGTPDTITAGFDSDLIFAVAGGSTRDKITDLAKTDQLIKL